MKFFSLTYLTRSVRIALAFPPIILILLQGSDLSMELHKQRLTKWSTIRERFRNRPKKLFGFKIYLNPDDLTPISSSIGTSGLLDLPLTCLLRKVVKRGMTVIDVGANIGYYTLLAAQIVGDEGRIYAFEPESLNFGLLEKSVRENHKSNIRIHQLALSDRNGLARLFKANASDPGGHSIGRDRGQGFEEVQCITLDESWENNGKPSIDMIKIHVAGDDPTVLRGCAKVLNEFRPMITMIFDPPKWRGDNDLLRYLFDIYDVYEVVSSPFLLRNVSLASLNRANATELFLSTPKPRRTPNGFTPQTRPGRPILSSSGAYLE